jgi:hypothetical protein
MVLSFLPVTVGASTPVPAVESALHVRDYVLLYRNVQQFPERLVFKAHRLLHYSTLGLRVIKQKEKGYVLLTFWGKGLRVSSLGGWTKVVGTKGVGFRGTWLLISSNCLALMSSSACRDHMSQ